MLIERKFILEMHDDYGMVGLRALGIEGFDPVMGRAVAHDFLEHAPDDDGSIAGEFQAFGAIQYVRGESGVFSIGPGEIVANDIRDIFDHFSMEGMEIASAPVPTEHNDYRGELDESLWGDLWGHMRRVLKSELLDTWGGTDEADYSRERSEIARFLSHRWHILRWLQIGYDRAQERYSNLGSWEVWQAFKAIQERADRFITDNEESGLNVATLSIRFDTESGELTFTEDLGYGDDYYEDEEE